MQADGHNAIPSTPSAFSQLSNLNPQPPQIPDHELLRLIGHGAYGEVWLARNAIGTLRAVKIVHRQSFQRAEHFERELKGLLQFEPISRSHDGLVDILQIGRRDDAGYFFYVMELADDFVAADVRRLTSNSALCTPHSAHDKSLLTSAATYSPKTIRSELQARGSLPPAECLTLGLKLAAALEHLHAHDLVHRDIKPSNIIFVDGEPKLADIGLVTAIDEAHSLVGTVGYIPPEGPGTPQADLYSLGKVLYEIALGKDRQEFPQLPPDLQSHPDYAVLLELNEVILKACETDPRQRYQSAEELRADLELLQRGKSVKRKRVLHHWLSAGKKVGLAIALLSVIVAVTLILRQRPSDPYMHSTIPGVDGLVTQGFTLVKTPGRNATARDLFNSAIELDPAFVPAYWGLCQAAINEGGVEQNVEGRRKLRAVAAKLMEIAPARAESRVASSCVKWVDWDFPGALADAQLATRMQATCQEARADAHSLHGYFLLESGQPERALVEYQMAERLDPAMSRFHHHLGHPYFAQRNFDEALKYYQKALYFQPQHSFAHFLIGRVYEEKGIVAGAKGLGDEEKGHFMAAIQEFESLDLMDGKNETDTKHFYDALREAVRQGGGKAYWRKRLDIALGKVQPDLYDIATLYARLGEKDKAYAWLQKACEKKSFDQGLMFDLCWDHDDPEFIAIAKGIGLLQ